MKIYPASETRRRQSGLFMTIFGILFAAPAVLAAFFIVSEEGADATGIAITLLFAAVGSIIALIGLNLRLRPKKYIFADRLAGLIVLYRRGRQLEEIPFTAAGPLAQIVDRRKVRTKNGTRNIDYYCVKSPILPGDFLYESTSELRTRGEAEKLARLMNVSLISPTGQERSPEELDIPFYRRFAGDDNAQAPATPLSGGTLIQRDLMPGTEIGTTHRPLLPVVLGIVAFLLTAGISLVLLIPTGMLNSLGGSLNDDEIVYSIFIVILMLLGAYALYRGVKAAFFPGKIVVTPFEIRYRGKKMGLEEIEEIERQENGLIRLIGDRRIVSISTYFCPDDEKAFLLHELRRAVIEAGIIGSGYSD